MPEAIYSAVELAVRYGDRVVLDGASAVVRENERAGLVGRNGGLRP